MQEAETRLTTPQAIANALESSFADLCHALEGLDADARETPGPDGGWSPKVELAHVAFWDAFQTGRMQAALEGRSVAGYPRPDHDNEQRAQSDAQRDWHEVLAAAQQARRQLIDFASRLQPSVLEQDYLEGERRFSVADQLRHMVRHTRNHTAPIQRRMDADAE